MKASTAKPDDKLHMSAREFDRIMGGVLATAAPVEPKTPVRRKRVVKKTEPK
jgi:hypothetical protein